MNLKNTQKVDSGVLGYLVGGTAYGNDGAEKYASTKHGPDGSVLLDPGFLPFIKNNVQGKRILDAGCGAAPWAILAGKHGASVDGIDIQKRMIEIGCEEVQKAGLTEQQVKLQIGSVNKLPYEKATFDKAISINVVCNLPSTMIVEESQEKVGLGVHLSEMGRVLKTKGEILVTTPASYEIVFTAGERKLSEIMQDIEQVLIKIEEEGQESVIKHLNSLQDVYRAVFTNNKDGKLELVTNINQLKNGCKMWYKLPGMTVPNVYHSENEIIEEAGKAGLTIVSTLKPQFNKSELDQHNMTHSEEPRLGESYVDHNIFTIFKFEKEKTPDTIFNRCSLY